MHPKSHLDKEGEFKCPYCPTCAGAIEEIEQSHVRSTQISGSLAEMIEWLVLTVDPLCILGDLPYTFQRTMNNVSTSVRYARTMLVRTSLVVWPGEPLAQDAP